ncbi:MAG: hypothetical protein D6736_00335 [Nitrospinota bacterium]|nr:MAG: hypothetical protein D6736_00335 [Nitrospinota bacterium]
MASFLVFLALPQQSLEARRLPKDFAFTETGDQPNVIFSHKLHVEEKGLKCKNCHIKIFQMKRGKTEKKKGKITMAAMGKGQFCGACHNGSKAFTVKDKANCTKCHVKK